MNEAVYRKVQRGKRVTYELVGNVSTHWHNDFDLLKPGQFRLEFASQDGMRRYAYPVSPDVAGWEAAAMIASAAMEDAIRKASQAKPMGVVHYTKKQLAVLAECRQKMEACGACLPTHWQFATGYDIARAAIQAVREYKP